MGKKSQSLVIANLICRFGTEKVLLDLIEEVVLPVFLSTSPPYVRRHGSTQFFFYGVKLVHLDDPVEPEAVALAGRFVKDTVLEREQVFVEGQGLVPDEDAIRSSPSAFFVLILHNHRLIYVRENVGAPSIEQFGSSLESMLRQRWKRYVEEVYRDRSEGEGRVTKTALKIEFPRPSVDIIRHTSEGGIEAFIKRFGLLKALEIRLTDRNDEIDNAQFFDLLRQHKERIGAKSSAVIHKNGEGLDLDQAAFEVREAAHQGTSHIKLQGTDGSGDVLRGNNKDFQITRVLDQPVEGGVGSVALRLYSIFKGVVEDGAISVQGASSKVRSILRRLLLKASDDE